MRRNRAGAGAAVALALAAGGCSLPPLRGKAEVGRDRYAIYIADVPGGSDIFAALPTGGPPIQVTFSPVEESGSALSPDGGAVLFFRHDRERGFDHRTIWVLNLLSGADRELVLPPKWKREPKAIAWSRDGRVIYVQTDGGMARMAAPPAAPAAAMVGGAELAQADSSFMVLVGTPAFAAVTACGENLCAVGPDGLSTPLAQGARGAARWGSDSVGYFDGDRFAIRPLGPGHTRFLEWSPAPDHPRDLTFFAGRR